MLSLVMQAAKGGHLQVVKVLLQGGADPCQLAVDGSGLFEYATLGGNIQVLEFLYNLGTINIHNRNNFGCTAVVILGQLRIVYCQTQSCQ